VATVLSYTNGQRGYPSIVRHVLNEGLPRSPRGNPTLDAGCVVIELSTPAHALPLGCGRNLSKNVAVAEAIQLIGGFHDPAMMIRASDNFTSFMDDGKFHGAYGGRIKSQTIDVVHKLKVDSESRQAIITLWDPALDNIMGMHDYPCTVMLQFEVIAKRLCMTTVMRSNDVWLGLPYDLFQFTQLQWTVAKALGYRPGAYRHVALSLHIYEANVEAAEKLYDPTDFAFQPQGIGVPNDPFLTTLTRARNLAGNIQPEDETISERWYREQLATFMG
jgi:thymidylate synthase